MRQLDPEERRIVVHLLHRAGRGDDLSDARVTEMNDGGMGSLRFAPIAEEQRFGAEIARIEVSDADGTPLSVSLNVDQHGRLFELDVWRVDFAPLQRWPSVRELEQAAAT